MLVVVGAGYAPPWDTDFELANGERVERLVWVGPTRSTLSPCLSCPGRTVSLLPDGTGKTTGQATLYVYAGFIGVTTLYVVPPSGSALPTVAARAVNRDHPSQTIELPVVRFSTIEALNPTVLSFPGASRSNVSHSNLFIAEVTREEGRGLSILVEAYSPAGDRLGSAAFDLSTGTALPGGRARATWRLGARRRPDPRHKDRRNGVDVGSPCDGLRRGAGLRQSGDEPVKWNRAAQTAFMVLAAVFCGAGAARGAVFKEFPVPTPASDPEGITWDYGGNIWFTEFEGNKIGRIDRDTQALTDFPVPTPSAGPASIISVLTATSSEMWFTEFRGNRIASLSRAGVITEYRLPSSSSGPRVIVENVDGGLWFTEFEGNRIGRITRSGEFTEFAIPTRDSGPYGIAGAPDYSLWFTEFRTNKIGRVTVGGAVTEFAITTPNSGPLEIVSGDDGNLWFAESRANRIGRITRSGVITEFPLPSPDRGPSGITRGPDGGLWFTERSANRLGRLSITGLLNEFSIPGESGSPAGIAAGNQDRRMWFTLSGADRIGSITRDRLVIVGAGQIGTWETILEIANPEGYTQGVWIGGSPEAPLACGICPGRTLGLPAYGSERTTVDSSPGTLYIDPDSVGVDPPTVVARVSNRARPSQAMDLPVVRMSTLEALDPSTLAFPSAIRSTEGHSNLLLAEVGGSQDIGTRIETFSAEGENLGSLDVFLGAGHSIFLIDALNRLGVSSLDRGQVRVTKTAGTGLMWGILTTVFEDGRVSVIVGANP